MTVQSLKYLSAVAVAAALFAVPHAAQAQAGVDRHSMSAADYYLSAIPRLNVEVINDLDTSIIVDLWTGGIGSIREPLIQARGVIARSGFVHSGLSCKTEHGCQNTPFEVRDVRGAILCKAWMKWEGGSVNLHVRSSGFTQAVCEFSGNAVDKVEISGSPYSK